ncbi:MAG: ribonuclease Z [Lachnospiraceae bacterium]
MIVIACIDDAFGMMFNNRRQSKDRILREYILEYIGDRKLWMNAYTKKQFVDCEQENIIVDEQFLERAKTGEFCFVENIEIEPYIEKIQQLILFKWNRSYPGDFFFPEEILSNGWTMIETEEFTGYSHEKITKEVYERDEK